MSDSQIHPLRRGYTGAAPKEVIEAVRRVISDWDGLNWLAVRHCLEATQPNADFDNWTMSDIRQRFAIAQKPITLQLGGKVSTTDSTITPVTCKLVVRTFAEWQRLLGWSASTWRRRREEFPECFTDVPGENACGISEPELSLWLASAASKANPNFRGA